MKEEKQNNLKLKIFKIEKRCFFLRFHDGEWPRVALLINNTLPGT